MGMTLYITDPVVAAAYFIHPAEFVWVPETAEALWLLANHHAYSLAHQGAMPAAYYVHPDAPNPFVPPPDLTPPDTKPAQMTGTTTRDAANVFSVTFSGGPDTAPATGYFFVLDTGAVALAHGNWAQPAGSTPDQAAALMQTALGAFGAVVATQQFGSRLELRGAGGKIILSVDVRLRVPKAAADPALSAPPAPDQALQSADRAVEPQSAPTLSDVDGV